MGDVMAVLAKDLFERVRILLQDQDSIRWPLGELRGWLNDGQREIVLQKPNAKSETVVLALQAGTYQKIADTYLSILRVVRNITADGPPRVGGRAVRTVPREILDATIPDWHDITVVSPKRVVSNVVYDQFDVRAFYTYPANDGTGRLEAVLSILPTSIPEPADPDDIAGYTSPIGLDDIYANALVDYILYRAYIKDASYAGNAQRAVACYTQFANALGIKLRNEFAASPNSPSPPVGGTAAAGA